MRAVRNSYACPTDWSCVAHERSPRMRGRIFLATGWSNVGMAASMAQADCAARVTGKTSRGGPLRAIAWPVDARRHDGEKHGQGEALRKASRRSCGGGSSGWQTGPSAWNGLSGSGRRRGRTMPRRICTRPSWTRPMRTGGTAAAVGAGQMEVATALHPPTPYMIRRISSIIDLP